MFVFLLHAHTLAYHTLHRLTLTVVSDVALQKSLQLKEDRIRVLGDRLNDALARNATLKKVGHVA